MSRLFIDGNWVTGLVFTSGPDTPFRPGKVICSAETHAQRRHHHSPAEFAYAVDAHAFHVRTRNALQRQVGQQRHMNVEGVDHERRLVEAGAEAIVLAGTDLNLAFDGQSPGYEFRLAM